MKINKILDKESKQGYNMGMDKRRNDKKGSKAVELYREGYSISEIANILGGTRQSIHDLLIRRDGYIPRKKGPAKAQYFNGRKYTERSNGYYLATTKPRTLMHRDVWEYKNGKIPDNHDIHHIDRDRSNNSLSNLVLLSKQEHARMFNTGKNQYSKKGV
jgi:hypothetical protein